LTFLEIGFVLHILLKISYVRIRRRKSFINRGLTLITRIFSPRRHEEHEEKLDRITGLTEVFGRPGVLGRICL